MSEAAREDTPETPMPQRSASDPPGLDVLAFNVGMPGKDAFKRIQDDKVEELARMIDGWFEKGVDVVGLNEIHETIFQKKLLGVVRQRHDVDARVHEDTNAILWCTP